MTIPIRKGDWQVVGALLLVFLKPKFKPRKEECFAHTLGFNAARYPLTERTTRGWDCDVAGHTTRHYVLCSKFSLRFSAVDALASRLHIAQLRWWQFWRHS